MVKYRLYYQEEELFVEPRREYIYRRDPARAPLSSQSAIDRHIARKAAHRKETPHPQEGEPSKKQIAINIHLPKIPSKKEFLSALKRIRQTPKKKLITRGALLCLFVGIIAWGLATRQETVDPAQTEPSKNDDSLVENLEYQTIIPEGRTISELGGWQQINPPGSEPVFAYVDKIGEVPISVSQQPLPQSLQGSAENQVADLAQKFYATTKITAGETTVYIGTSAKGPQSAIFTRNGLLILIKSQLNIPNDDWVAYINLLN